MPGETDLHRSLKKDACRWLFNNGYSAVACEVCLRPLGIVDAAGTGVFGPATNHFGVRRFVHQTCIIECKQSRGDFLRDHSNDGQMQLCLMERRLNTVRRGRRVKQSTGLGKFKACLLQPFANLHYLLAPAGLIKKTEVPPRWGLLSSGPAGISVVVKATWQDCAGGQHVESAIARTLTAGLHRADSRAIFSLNREMINQQQDLAARIRKLKPSLPDEEAFALLFNVGHQAATVETRAEPASDAAAGFAAE